MLTAVSQVKLGETLAKDSSSCVVEVMYKKRNLTCFKSSIILALRLFISTYCAVFFSLYLIHRNTEGSGNVPD